ncbi:MAG: LON peptidase substrate-binding domain-containing protein, partial [Patescibacteria group bacterium]
MVFTTEKSLPVVAVREGIVLPGTENVLIFGRNKSTQAINEALKRDKKLILVMQKTPSVDNPALEELYDIGTVVMIKNVVYGDKGEINALVRGVDKVRIEDYSREEPYFEASFKTLAEKVVDDEETRGFIRYISTQVKKAINLGKTIDFIFLMNILNVRSPQDFSFQVAMVLDLREKERQDLLEENDVKKRLKKEIDFINREIKVLEIEQNISAKTQRKVEQGMKESILREKMKTIEEELGGKGEDKELNEYKVKIKKARMPKDVEEKAFKELKRLVQMSQFNPESS